jgi:DNA-binding transcriptional LysR family regulator
MSGPIRSADIAELRAFCAAVDLGSLGRAARLLRVSQPALSKRLRVLETLAGARLLERSPRGVSLTPAGARLYAEARKLLAQAETIDALLAGLSSEDAPVRLAASHTIAEYVLPGPLVEFEQRRERHLSVELIIANSLVVRELVREGRAEFGIAATGRDAPPDGFLRELPFCDDEVVVGVPPDHPWAKRRTVPIAELTRVPMIMRDPSANTRRVVQAALQARGLQLQPPLAEVGSTSAAKATALREGAPVLLAAIAAAAESDDLVVRRVSGVDFRRRFVILLGAPEVVSASALALVEHLLDGQGVDLAITAG